MSTNKTISTGNTLSIKVLRLSTQIPGYEKIKISARKWKCRPKKLKMPESERGCSPSPPPRTLMFVSSLRLFVADSVCVSITKLKNC